ncbi:PHP domain-containing protein [Vallitalea okinawensis]|uniref:PHP domain-containing protein n=1 Tax=Vallitalea okinawensis TaxID=2078660 RepID=UPI000CFC17A0|nr:PHP domain-containing protein [Vallitalea okinawensis]
MKKYDLHVHTSEVSRCAHTKAEDLVKAYKKLDFTGIVITDHFGDPSYLNSYGNIPWQDKVDIFLEGYQKAKRAGDEVGLDVFLGVELRLVPKIEFIIYGLDKSFLMDHENLQLLSPKELYKLVTQHDLLMYQAHPFRNGVELAPYQYMSGIEVINGGQPEEVNQKAYTFAKEKQLRCIAGSDNHRNGADKCGIMTESRIKSSKDLLQILRTEDYKIFCGLPYGQDNPIRVDERYIMTKRRLLSED